MTIFVGSWSFLINVVHHLLFPFIFYDINLFQFLARLFCHEYGTLVNTSLLNRFRHEHMSQMNGGSKTVGNESFWNLLVLTRVPVLIHIMVFAVCLDSCIWMGWQLRQIISNWWFVLNVWWLRSDSWWQTNSPCSHIPSNQQNIIRHISLYATIITTHNISSLPTEGHVKPFSSDHSLDLNMWSVHTGDPSCRWSMGVGSEIKLSK